MYAVYIVGRLSGTLYIGVTNDLVRRVWEHKNRMADGFTKRTESTGCCITKISTRPATR